MKEKRLESQNRFKSCVNERKVKIVIGVVSTAVLGYFGYKYVPKLVQDSVKTIPQERVTKQLISVVDTIKEVVEPIVEKKSPRYLVEFKAFKSGDWYPKTRTDYINSAYSVASCKSFGRAYRIIDTETGSILKEVLEDASMASCNGYPSGYPW